ncbi:hypothetical protein B4140_0846 [Bacillus amyloliquefaciens]|nr:hypothetical protein B4140_0846 [Bacillus amyloliquefaciens]
MFMTPTAVPCEQEEAIVLSPFFDAPSGFFSAFSHKQNL